MTPHSKSCRGKRRHRTAGHARIALRLTIQATGDGGLVIYPCNACGGWHVGHPPKCEQRRLRYTRLINLIDKANGRTLQ